MSKQPGIWMGKPLFPLCLEDKNKFKK